jgi:predicted dehydrogenase
MPETVYATGWKSPSGCWDHLVTCLNWSDGTRAAVETSISMTGAFPFSIEFRGCGEKGTLCYSLTAGHNIKDGGRGFDFNFYPADGEGAVQLSAEQADMFAGEIEGFLDAIRSGAEAPVTPNQSRDVLKIVLAVKRSLEECVVQRV